MCASPVDAAAVRLSRREHEIALLVAEGLTNREIAGRLFISERTVDGHLEHLREKLAVNTRAQIATWIVRQGSDGVLTARAAPAAPAPMAPPAQGWTGIARRPFWLASALVLALAASAVVALLVRPPAPSSPPGPTIKTIAGTDSGRASFPGGGYAGDGFPAITAQLSRPSDVVAGQGGFIYIADYGNHVVRRVAPDGQITTLAGGGTNRLTEGAVAASVSLPYPSNIAVDASGLVYMLMSRDGSLEVWKIRSDRTLTFVVSLGRTRGGQDLYWREPLGGVAVAPDGTLYVADRAENRVWRWSPGGPPTAYAGSGQAGFLGDGSAASSAELWFPAGLAIDQKENLYIADSGNNRIRMVDRRTGIIDTIAGSGDTASLSLPYGVAVGADGRIVIADTGNNRLREITASGKFLAVAGTGRAGFNGDDGPASQAELNGPQAVAFDSSGNLLVADTANHRVREVLRLSR
jgi:DNA-binding CsgD family transcriptional regulator/DNA-binding beta-propeller fold protein YncE